MRRATAYSYFTNARLKEVQGQTWNANKGSWATVTDVNYTYDPASELIGEGVRAADEDFANHRRDQWLSFCNKCPNAHVPHNIDNQYPDPIAPRFPVAW